jgi:hypothetical protein
MTDRELNPSPLAPGLLVGARVEIESFPSGRESGVAG